MTNEAGAYDLILVPRPDIVAVVTGCVQANKAATLLKPVAHRLPLVLSEYITRNVVPYDDVKPRQILHIVRRCVVR